MGITFYQFVRRCLLMDAKETTMPLENANCVLNNVKQMSPRTRQKREKSKKREEKR